MSNKTKTDTTTQQNKLDPRMESAIYDTLLPRAQGLLGQSPINARMREGMDTQYNYLTSPLYSSIFNTILGQGMGMMGQGVAGNPYTQMAGMRNSRRGAIMPSQAQWNPQFGQQAKPQQTALQVPVLLGGDGMTEEQRRQLAFLWGQDQNARTG